MNEPVIKVHNLQVQGTQQQAARPPSGETPERGSSTDPSPRCAAGNEIDPCWEHLISEDEFEEYDDDLSVKIHLDEKPSRALPRGLLSASAVRECIDSPHARLDHVASILTILEADGWYAIFDGNASICVCHGDVKSARQARVRVRELGIDPQDLIISNGSSDD